MEVVREEAATVAAAWSPRGAPDTWRLTAAQFDALHDDAELVAIASTIAPDRLPPLLFTAAANSLVLRLEPRPLRDSFPRLGQPQPPLDRHFRRDYRAFCLDHRDQLLELCACHRYQMNEVGRCAHIVAALGPEAEEERELALIDVGTGAGLGLHLDRYRYVFRGPGPSLASAGGAGSELTLAVDIRGTRTPPAPSALPRVVERVGVDIEPLDLDDAGVRAWLAACVPQEIGAVTRFHAAAQVTIEHPARRVRGDASEVLPEILAAIPDGPLVCVVDSYVHVFFEPDELARFRAIVDGVGAERDLDWISIDPLVPMGRAATSTVIGTPAPTPLLERNRSEGVFGVLAKLAYRRGRRSAALLAIGHPSGVWLEWLAPSQAERGR